METKPLVEKLGHMPLTHGIYTTSFASAMEAELISWIKHKLNLY